LEDWVIELLGLGDFFFWWWWVSFEVEDLVGFNVVVGEGED
jgi:hypothetical protein